MLCLFHGATAAFSSASTFYNTPPQKKIGMSKMAPFLTKTERGTPAQTPADSLQITFLHAIIKGKYVRKRENGYDSHRSL